MNIAAKAQSLLVDVNRPGNLIRDAWNVLSKLPAGKLMFSKLIGQAAPYTSTIDARVKELSRGYAKVCMADRRSSRNHLSCVHAIALANLAELTGNVAVAYSLPDDARFIVAGLSIDYLKKARGRITGECECPVPERADKHTYQIQVVLRDDGGQEVARATLQTLVGPKPVR